MEDIVKKLSDGDVQSLLKKNKKAAKVLEQNRKKMIKTTSRRPKEYGLGLPYARPALVASTDYDSENEHSEHGGSGGPEAGKARPL